MFKKMYLIKAPDCTEITVSLPTSKSITHRIYILAGLNKAATTITNGLHAGDTSLTLDALVNMGISADMTGEGLICRQPIGTVIEDNIYLGNSGSSARFLVPLAAFLDKAVYFYGETRLHQRPFAELFRALEKLNVRYQTDNLSLPATIYPSEMIGGDLHFESLPSSQIITALMLAGLWMKNDLSLFLPQKTPSLPYIKMTLQLMRRLGLEVTSEDNCIWIKARQPNYNWFYDVEKDLSAASYWVIFSLINQVKVTMPGVTLPSLQGDERILQIAEEVGGKVMLYSDRVEISGTIENGATIDCNDIPDLVPALSVLALFAPQSCTMMNIKHLEYKESNRIAAIQANIAALGGKSEYEDGNLCVHPQKRYQGAQLSSYNDHRIAMSFAVAGTRIKQTIIENPDCVKKSYPDFWDHFTFWKEIKYND
jgi:3-phosphoshikimate 1-carboxyvinyltransferase